MSLAHSFWEEDGHPICFHRLKAYLTLLSSIWLRISLKPNHNHPFWGWSLQWRNKYKRPPKVIHLRTLHGCLLEWIEYFKYRPIHISIPVSESYQYWDQLNSLSFNNQQHTYLHLLDVLHLWACKMSTSQYWTS